MLNLFLPFSNIQNGHISTPDGPLLSNSSFCTVSKCGKAVLYDATDSNDCISVAPSFLEAQLLAIYDTSTG